MRSGDENVFWLARCCDDVSELQPRWPANYFSLSVAHSGGDDEYIMCASTDFIWRDVVLADITNSVRVVGKKLWLPKQLEHELKNYDASNTPSTSTVEHTTSVQSPVEMIPPNILADLRSRTTPARRMVSVFIGSKFKVNSR